ncbi:MAG: hypothetical protein V4671_15400 [Armatimonadota bacterium]
MNWYKIIAEDGKNDIDTQVGSSPDSPAKLADPAILTPFLARRDGIGRQYQSVERDSLLFRFLL